MITKLNENDVKLVYVITQLLEKDYRYKYTHQQLAAKVGTNESKLRVTFKYVHKKTIHDFVTDLRIEKIKELLVSTDWCLNVIASHTGYKTAGMLIRGFKNKVGLTPLEWKSNQERSMKRIENKIAV